MRIGLTDDFRLEFVRPARAQLLLEYRFPSCLLDNRNDSVVLPKKWRLAVNGSAKRPLFNFTFDPTARSRFSLELTQLQRLTFQRNSLPTAQKLRPLRPPFGVDG